MCLVLPTEGNVPKDLEKLRDRDQDIVSLSQPLSRGGPGFQTNDHLNFSLKFNGSAFGLSVSGLYVGKHELKVLICSETLIDLIREGLMPLALSLVLSLVTQFGSDPALTLLSGCLVLALPNLSLLSDLGSSSSELNFYHLPSSHCMP